MKLRKPFEKDGKKITEIKFDFEKITGNDIIAAEKEARLMGDSTPDAAYSKTFQAVLAAKAAIQPVNTDDIMGMNGSDFMAATTAAASFLFGWALPKSQGNI